jgi:hypothetical protein
MRHRPGNLVWVSPRLTRATGCVMRRLRRVRLLWRIREGLPVMRLAGRMPVWFRDRHEYEIVSALARGSLLPA